LILGKPEDVKKIKDLLKKEFGTVEDGQLRKLLGIRYKWMRTIEGRPYIVSLWMIKERILFVRMKNILVRHLKSTVAQANQEKY
jgi:hypothetical protein